VLRIPASATRATDQVGALIAVTITGELGSNELMKTMGLSHRPTFRENHLNPALADGWIERIQPDTPRSPTQRYHLTAKGHRWLQQLEKG
jgi:DNA-binding HxlR family transcriptional regulator